MTAPIPQGSARLRKLLVAAAALSRKRDRAATYMRLLELKGLPHKIGQHLALRRGLDDALTRQLLTTGAPLPDAQLLSVLDRELPATVRDRLEVNGPPIAAGSIAQVYLGRLDGALVAIKILYPGIEDTVHADLRGIERLVPVLAALLPPDGRSRAARRAYLSRTIKALTEELIAETDLIREARLTTRFSETLPNAACCPAVVEEASTARVLTTSFIDGRPLLPTLAEVSPDERASILKDLVECYLGMLFKTRMLHADPHPGNLLWRPDTRQIAILDFGQVLERPEPWWAALAAAVKAAKRGVDPDDALPDHFVTLGFEAKDVAALTPALLEISQVVFGPLIDPDPDRGDLGRRLETIRARHGVTAPVEPPAGMVFVMRTFGAIEYIVGKSGGQIDWAEIYDKVVAVK